MQKQRSKNVLIFVCLVRLSESIIEDFINLVLETKIEIPVFLLVVFDKRFATFRNGV